MILIKVLNITMIDSKYVLNKFYACDKFIINFFGV